MQRKQVSDPDETLTSCGRPSQPKHSRKMTVTRFDTVKIFLNTFQIDDAGAAGIEYAMIAGLISIVIIAAASTIGTNISAMMSKVQVKSAVATSAT
jgi:pilus assembly protein Flp/PilA